MKCPFCESTKVEFTEVWYNTTDDYGIAVECLNCGLRSPVVEGITDIEKADENALKLWNKIQIVKDE